jgi:hypothetical protein
MHTDCTCIFAPQPGISGSICNEIDILDMCNEKDGVNLSISLEILGEFCLMSVIRFYLTVCFPSFSSPRGPATPRFLCVTQSMVINPVI